MSSRGNIIVITKFNTLRMLLVALPTSDYRHPSYRNIRQSQSVKAFFQSSTEKKKNKKKTADIPIRITIHGGLSRILYHLISWKKKVTLAQQIWNFTSSTKTVTSETIKLSKCIYFHFLFGSQCTVKKYTKKNESLEYWRKKFVRERNRSRTFSV